MSRVKFRAWDKKRRVLAQVTNIGWDDGLIEVEGYNLCPPFSEVILEQYTGLKDKNGVEICEGDIVDIGGRHYEIYWAGYGGRYDGRRLGIKKESYLTTDYSLGFKAAMAGEVIGNIHENPELLEGEK